MSTTDEIMGLADLYYHNPYREGSHTHLVYADQKRAALLKAVESLAVDAARYRWLRVCEFDSAVMYGDTTQAQLMMEDVLDAAIDKQINWRETP